MKLSEIQSAVSRYANIRENIRSAISTINPVELVTPVNLTEAKKNWIENAKKGAFLNPSFVYDQELLRREAQKLPMLRSLKSSLDKFTPVTEATMFVHDQLAEVVSDAICSAELASAIAFGYDEMAASRVITKYGRPSQDVYQLALDLAEHGFAERYRKSVKLSPKDTELLQTTQLDAQFIKEMFIWAMKQYGQPWPVEILDDCNAIDVRDKSSFGHPIIAIPATRAVNGFKLVELIGHEIEAHWLGSQNAELIGALKVDSELIYEGVAKFKDYQFGAQFLGEATMPSPYYVIAEREALAGRSFAEVGKTMVEYLNGDVARAWTFTCRTFRGITNTTNRAGYAFTKDRAYLEGFLQVRQMVKNGDEALLNFSTLSPSSLQRLSELIDCKNLSSQVLQDKHIQETALREILHRIKRGNH